MQWITKTMHYFFVIAGFLSFGILQSAPMPSQSTQRQQSNNQFQPPSQHASGKEEVAYNYSYDRSGYDYGDSYYNQQPNNGQRYYNHQDNNASYDRQQNEIERRNHHPGHPMTDWDYKESWQYNQKDYYEGKTQPEVYREHHPYGHGGIGYDGDPEYLRLEKMENDYYQQKEKLDKLLSENEKALHPNTVTNNQNINGENNHQSYPTQSPNNTSANSHKQNSYGDEITATDADQRRSIRERKNGKAYQNPRVAPQRNNQG